MCGGKKPLKCKARDLYDSTWFRYAWHYAQSLNSDKIFILSAKYGLVDPDAEIEPYEETLNTKSDKDIRAWANAVVNALRKKVDLKNDVFIILAGEKYRRHITCHLTKHEVPMDGLRIGQQLKWLKERCTK